MYCIALALLPVVLQLLAFGPASWAKSYDAEDDIGLVAEDASPVVAARNTKLLSAAFAAQWKGGQFRFRDGKTGPILRPITAAGKEFYFAGTIQTAAKAGGLLIGAGGRVPIFASNHYRADASGGMVTRFTRIDGQAGGALLRICGPGFTVRGIEFRGRRYDFDPTGEGPEGKKSLPQGTSRTPIGIEIEGRTSPPTGWTYISDCAFTEFDHGICARAGHYQGDKFVAHENHADTSVVERVLFSGCGSCFRSENEQSVCWSFRDITVHGHGPEVVVFDLKVGGITADGVWICHPRTTLVQVRDFYSQNANRIDLTNVKWDRAGEGYYRIFRYSGPEQPHFDLAHAKWAVRITGHLSPSDQRDTTKLFDVPQRFPLDGVLLDVEGLPRGKFEPVPSGPWVRPKGK
jgi:hypothetical protein